MTLSAEDMDVLQEYSAGRISWRAACNMLNLMEARELHALMDAHKIPAPVADMSPPHKETVARFKAVLEGESGDDA
jgi:hypothetical protein